jgi:hypothetical protein
MNDHNLDKLANLHDSSKREHFDLADADVSRFF